MITKQEKSKYLCSLFAVILGLILAITGIVVLVFAENHCGPSGSGISRASTEIKFGTDYYTHMAQYNALTANTAVDIYKLLKICFGITFVFSGLLTIFLNLPNTLKLFSLPKKSTLPVDESIKTEEQSLIEEEM